MSSGKTFDWPSDPFDEFDFEEDEYEEDEYDGPSHSDDLRVQFAFDVEHTGRIHLSTEGLWELGVPELSLWLPRDLDLSDRSPRGHAVRLILFLSTGLFTLAHRLSLAGDFDIPPYQGDFDGRPVTLWLGPAIPTEGPLALLMGPEADTVFPVECSLWTPPAAGCPGCEPSLTG